MAAGLIAGAIGGLGKAMQHNAQGQIEEKRKRALMALEQEMALEHEEVRHGNTLERDEVQHGHRLDELGQQHEYGLEELGARHGYSMEQERYRQGQQNRRTFAQIGARRAEGRNDWQLVPTEDGGYAQWSPSRNEYRPANLPEGAQMNATGELSDRDKYRLDGLRDQMEAIQERASDEMRELTPEEKAELGRLQGQYDSLLGGGGGMTPFERLMAGEEGAEGGEEGPPPDSIPGLIAGEQQRRQNTQEANEARRAASDARDKADAVIERIERERAGGATPGGIMAGANRAAGRGGVSDEALAEAQQVAEDLLALDANTNLSDDQKRWLAERLMRLQDAGVPLNLEQ